MMKPLQAGLAALFVLAVGAGGAQAQSTDPEVLFWQSIANSTDGAEYCAYLQAFPTGSFAGLARIRAKKLGGSCAGDAAAGAPKAMPKDPKEIARNPDGTPTESFFTTDNYYEGKRAFDAGDHKKAVEIWMVSAEQGFPEAQGFIGGMYHGGFGVEKDYAKAMEWYMKAAEKGVAQAQLGIGNLYGDGLGVEKDYVKAHMWFSIASNGGNERASYNVKKVEQRMNEADIAKGKAMALEWIKAH